MDNTPTAELQQRLAELQEIFQQQLPGRIDEISCCWQELQQHWSGQRSAQLYRLSHSLAGNGGAFGAEEICTIARSLEQGLKLLSGEMAPPDSETMQQLDGMVAALSDAAKRCGERQADTEAPLKPHTVKLLYIEDNPVSLKLVRMVLEKQPHIHLETAQEPHLGLELAHNNPPDLILLDINLPGIDGYEVLSRLRADSKTAHIPTIAVSAHDLKPDRQKGRENGFDDYITKPINLQHFTQTINAVLQRAQTSGSDHE